MTSSILRGTRPDLTAAQLVGVLVAGVPVLATLLRAFGAYDLSAEQQQALQDALTWGGVLAGLLLASDAGLRAARNAADARRDAAALASPAQPHAAPEALEDAGAEPGFADDAAFAALLGGDDALPDERAHT
jgi:hypothetical protein